MKRRLESGPEDTRPAPSIPTNVQGLSKDEIDNLKYILPEGQKRKANVKANQNKIWKKAENVRSRKRQHSTISVPEIDLARGVENSESDQGDVSDLTKGKRQSKKQKVITKSRAEQIQSNIKSLPVLPTKPDPRIDLRKSQSIAVVKKQTALKNNAKGQTKNDSPTIDYDNDDDSSSFKSHSGEDSQSESDESQNKEEENINVENYAEGYNLEVPRWSKDDATQDLRSSSESDVQMPLSPSHYRPASTLSFSSGVLDLPDDSDYPSEPHQPQGDSDSDDNLATQAPPAINHHQQSSRATVDSDEEKHLEQAPLKSKSKNKKTRRQEAHDMEQPVFRTHDKPQKTAHRTRATLMDKSWSEVTQIVYPKKANGDITLGDQKEDLKAVIRGAIAHMIEEGLFENAFPSYSSRATFSRISLIAAANKVNSPAAKQIRQRLEQDPSMAEELADLPIQRLNLVRKNVKQRASAMVIACYGLSGMEPEKISAQIAELKVNDRYVFATKVGSTKIIKKDIYLHTAIKDLIRDEFFDGKRSFGMKHINDFNSSHENKSEPELPIAMVALAATAIYAALSEWDDGIKKSASFHAEIFQGHYCRHVSTLEKYHCDHALEFHRVMSSLFTAAVGGSRPQAVASSSGGALALLNISDEE